jgi:hypothetical protein
MRLHARATLGMAGILAALVAGMFGVGLFPRAGAAVASPHHRTPAWAASLGPGVTIIGPGTQPATGTTSPGGVVESVTASSNSGHLAQSCAYVQPAVQAKCSAATGSLPPISIEDRLTLGYIAVKGTQALVGTVGSDCESDAHPKCITNQNPAKLFSSGHNFQSLYTSAVASESSPIHKYSLITCVKVASQWYVYQPPSAF